MSYPSTVALAAYTMLIAAVVNAADRHLVAPPRRLLPATPGRRPGL